MPASGGVILDYVRISGVEFEDDETRFGVRLYIMAWDLSRALALGS